VSDDSPWFPSRALSRRPLAAEPEEVRRSVRDVQGAGGRGPSPALLNNLGIVQLRAAARRRGQPGYFFNKAADADPDDEDFLFNLGYAYWLDRDAPAAIYWLREAVRRSPADADAHFVLARLWPSAPAAPKRRASASWRAASRTPTHRAKRPGGDTVPKGLERLKQEVELPHARQIGARLASSEQRSSEELARFYLERRSVSFSRKTIATRSSK